MRDEATLCVLAGGEGKRMGRAKAELEINGKPILAHLLDRLKWDGATMLVTAPGREHPPACQRFDCELVDPAAGQGPLRGLLTALQNLGTEICVLISVDMPNVERGQLRWLVSALRDRPRSLGIMTRHVVLEPFPSIYRRDAINAVHRRLNSDQPALKSLVDEFGFDILDAPTGWDASVWVNLNSPADLQGLG